MELRHAFSPGAHLPNYLLDACVIGAVITDAQQDDFPMVYVNPAFEQLSGYSAAELLGRNCRLLQGEDRDQSARHEIRVALEEGRGLTTVLRNYRKDGTRFFNELTLSPLHDSAGILTHYLGFQNDVTAREEARQAEVLACQQMTTTLGQMPNGFMSFDRNWNLTYVNQTAARVLGEQPEDLVGQNLLTSYSEYVGSDIGQAVQRAAETGTSQSAISYLPAFGRWIELTAYPGKGGETSLFTRDVTESQRAQQERQVSEERFSKVFQTTPVAMFISQQKDQRFIEVNEEFLRQSGYTREEIIGRSSQDLGMWDDQKARQAVWRKVDRSLPIHGREVLLRSKAGAEIWGVLSLVPTEVAGEACMIGFVLIITEEKRAQRQLEHSEERARYSAAALQHTLDLSLDLITSVGPDQRLLTVSAACHHMLGYEPEEMLGRPISDFVHPEDRAMTATESQHIRSGQATTTLQNRLLHKGGRVVWLEWSAVVSPDDGVVYGVGRDITQRRAAEKVIQALNEDLQRQLRSVTGLREIDHSIAGSADLDVTLGLILDHVRQQLEVDVAAILLFDPQRKMLRYAVTRGFYAARLEKSGMKLGAGLAGRVALSQQPLNLPNLSRAALLPAWREILQNEKLAAYYGVPLVIQGQVVGVIEVMRHQPWALSLEWLATLETLVSQAAIAINNARLVNELERSNAELRSAYDETIEGWARALDLRDRATEGHSRRVTEMTAELCQALGFTPEQLINVRRGALLHDMGKMGIPDAVLFKPGSLTDEEWVLMKKHPEYAVDLLSPIEFLRPALDIPQSHHEKWDGSGYPVGLANEAIPLAARAFAVVDVYDALTSDRPYRPAWTRERTLAHLRNSSGTHFDPEVVDVFIKLIQQA